MNVVNEDELRRRIKAARALAGLNSADELAERLRDQGLGPRTVRKMESGERPVRPMELRAIAEACGLPYEFFTVDFASLEGATIDAHGWVMTTAISPRAIPLDDLWEQLDRWAESRSVRLARESLPADATDEEIVERYREDVSRVVAEAERDAARQQPTRSSETGPGQDQEAVRHRRPA